jgi:hypothetical protein
MDSANGVSKNRSWNDAKAACVAAGGVLATINTKGLNDFLAGLTTKGMDVWIGLNDIKQKGKYVMVQRSQISKKALK